MVLEYIKELIMNINLLGTGVWIPLSAIAVGLGILISKGDKEDFLKVTTIILWVFSSLIFLKVEGSGYLLAEAIIMSFVLMKPGNMIEKLKE